MREVSEQPPREDVDGNVENENEDIGEYFLEIDIVCTISRRIDC